MKKYLFLIAFLCYSVGAYAQVPPIGTNNKDVFDLMRESIAKEAKQRAGVLKLYPVDVDDQRYYDLDQGKKIRDKHSSTIKSLFDYDPLDSMSLVIQVDKELLLQGLGISGDGTNGEDGCCSISEIDISTLEPEQCEALITSMIDCMTIEQSIELLQIFNFSELSPEQCAGIFDCFDITQMPITQITQLTTIVFDNLTLSQCQGLALCLVSADLGNGLTIGSDGKLFVDLNANDHMNRDQDMTNGDRLHIINGRLQYVSAMMGGVNGFDILNSNGTYMFSVDLN